MPGVSEISGGVRALPDPPTAGGRRVAGRADDEGGPLRETTLQRRPPARARIVRAGIGACRDGDRRHMPIAGIPREVSTGELPARRARRGHHADPWSPRRGDGRAATP